MFCTDYVRKDILAGPITLSYTLGECRELWDEIKVLNWKEARAELDDVGGCLTLLIAQATGLNLPILPGFGHGAVVRWIERRKTWERIFSVYGMVFHRSFLFDPTTGQGGGNFRKRHKVESALRRAGYLGSVDYDGLLSIVGNWEG